MLIIQFSHVDYITSKQGGSGYARRSFLLNEYEPDVKSKVYLLKHFERYIMDRLYGEYSFTFEDLDRTRGLDFVQKYLRMKHVIVFKLRWMSSLPPRSLRFASFMGRSPTKGWVECSGVDLIWMGELFEVESGPECKLEQ